VRISESFAKIGSSKFK